MMQRCLPRGTRSSIVPTMADALAHGWARVQPGDRLVFIADEVDDVSDLIRSVTERSAEDAACEAPIAREPADRPAFAR